MQKSPKGFRLHIGIFGRRNVGKSSFLNMITRQNVSIVSEFAGTTTDPVEKTMEFLPLGPVLFIDTAGLDDFGKLGNLRIKKTEKIFDRTDIGIIVAEANKWETFEEQISQELIKRNIPTIVVLNKIDLYSPEDDVIRKIEVLKINSSSKINVIKISAKKNLGILDFRQALLDSTPEDFINNPAIIRDLVNPGECAILVTPIDKEAPRGRLILPQVQTIRDLLDGRAYCNVVQQTELGCAIKNLKITPKIVVTDSQCFEEVAQITPKNILLTSFSILFSRFKGDLLSQVIGSLAIDNLQHGDKVLISEACSHHPIKDDIGRVKIPNWLNKHIGGEIDFTIVQGHDFPDDLSDYKLVIHCGACMLNRREVLNRILFCRRSGVPCTNYGLLIAHCLGILDRALGPFPDALNVYSQ